MKRLLPKGGSTIGPPSVFAAVSFIAAVSVFAALVLLTVALAGFAPSAFAATELAGSKITPTFPDGEPGPPTITSSAAILIDADSGRVLYSRNADERQPMASTTKIMTAVLVLELLKLDTKVTISANVPATIGSSMGLQKGQVLTVEQLMYALLVPSANDAAVALAEKAAGSTQAFVKKMNEKAKSLGLSNTHFVNPSGLNAANHFSSAKDLATLAQYAMRDPIFRRIVRTREYTIPMPGQNTPHKYENHNLLLGRQAWVTGVKTGSTPYAKYCLVASATRDGVSVISVLLGAVEDEVRWKESEALLTYGFNLYPRTVLADKGRVIAEVPVPDSLDRRVRLVADRSLVVSIFKSDVVTSTVRLDREVTLPVRVGDVFGAVEFTLGGKSLGSANLVAALPVDQATIKMLLQHWRDVGPPLWLDSYRRVVPLQ